MVWVVKIGGSLANNERLIDWLNLLANLDQAIVIVPGGGAFADQVRRFQLRWQFSDDVAHQMAILAMHQFGLMMADLDPRLDYAVSAYNVVKKLDQGFSTIIWLPSIEELQQDRVPASWDVSADSLAAWLCSKLNADRLILIKSAETSVYKECSVPALQQNNIVDQAFAEMIKGLDCSLTVLGRNQLDLFPSQVDKNR
ncbi:MAG TPA: hypothetical protein ENJ32_00870 [Crenotrichaceae bacterium]|nr:hypothetical protein [Crenotrichaceae bacterium]